MIAAMFVGDDYHVLYIITYLARMVFQRCMKRGIGEIWRKRITDDTMRPISLNLVSFTVQLLKLELDPPGFNAI